MIGFAFMISGAHNELGWTRNGARCQEGEPGPTESAAWAAAEMKTVQHCSTVSHVRDNSSEQSDFYKLSAYWK